MDKQHSFPEQGGTRWKTRLLLVAAAASLAACASGGKSGEGDGVAVGTTAIETARTAGADEFAAVEINNARVKLERARLLSQAGKKDEARELAEEAAVDAQVAQTKAAAERSARALAEVQAGMKALQEKGNEAQKTEGQKP